MCTFDLLFYVYNTFSEISGLTSICLLLTSDSWDALYSCHPDIMPRSCNSCEVLCFLCFLRRAWRHLSDPQKRGEATAVLFFYIFALRCVCSLIEKDVCLNCEPANAKGICYIGLRVFLTVQRPWLKQTAVSHCFFCLKKKSDAVKLVIFASLLCVKCKDVTLINIFFYIFKTIFTETITMKSSVKRELLSLCCGV